MKFQKNIYKKCCLAVVVLLPALISSCKKLIEIPANPTDKIPTSQVFVDSVNTVKAIAGIYTNLKIVDNYSFLFANGGVTAYTGLSGDELLGTRSYYPEETQFRSNSILVSNSVIAGLWNDAYSSIYQINSCLSGVTTSTGISAALKKQLTGEIKVIRAFYYFNLVNTFGAVPVVTGTDYTVNAVIPNSSTDAVYNQIIDDLKDARGLLTATNPSAGRARPNLYTASALLAKVYLYKQQWQNAADLASSIIKSGRFSLVSNLSGVFLDGSQEAIWQLPAKGTYTQTAEGAVFIPGYAGAMPNFILTTNLLTAFETGDQRKSKWLGTSTVGTQTYYYPYKYKNNTTSALPLEGYMMLRLGEQYLIRAEALANVNKLDSALADVNSIRLRAGLAAKATTTDLLAAIMHERQTELFCEMGNRWFDLKRTGTIDAILGTEKTGWKSTSALYPIPLAQLQTNPFLKQNPGY